MPGENRLLTSINIRNRRSKETFLRSSKKDGFMFFGCFRIYAREFNLLFLTFIINGV